jgi:nicotinate-nucleotide adenylyltransferase
MRIGIFGGTFDPPHLGHLILANEALDQLHLNRLLWMVTAIPPHKRNGEINPLEQRLALTQAAIGKYQQFELSMLEIDRPGPHYAVDTVALVKEQNPSAEVYYIMGEDSLRDLPTWYKPDLFIELCTGFGVMRRPGTEMVIHSLAERFPGIEEKIFWFQTPLVDISSRDIRQRILDGRPYRFFVPEDVFSLIEKNKYYQ